MLLTAVVASAATKQEMEQARALAAKWGVRSQNSGSGYLDGINPKNMDQVRASVKSHKTDNGNLSKLSFSMPSEEEYQSWDNAKMTAYWISQYNSAVPGGGDKEFCRSKLKAQLSSVPATVKKTQRAENAKAEDENKIEDELAAEASVDSTEVNTNDELATDIVDAAAADPEVEPLTADENAGEREALGSKELASSGSNVWAIIMLVVLVLIVLGLVGYATNMMARNKEQQQQDNPRRRRNDVPVDNVDDDSQYEEPRQEPSRGRMPAVGVANMAEQENRTMASHRPAPRISQPRIIYLSSANAEGVFVRADAKYNMGNSIFKLITSDGYSGTFSVIDDPNVHELALMMPVDFLVNACSGRNLQLSQGARSIVTDSTGTAVFEDGRWRVARKAQIHYAR